MAFGRRPSRESISEIDNLPRRGLQRTTSDRPVRRTGSGRRAPYRKAAAFISSIRRWLKPLATSPRPPAPSLQYRSSSAIWPFLRKRVVRFVVVEGRGEVLTARTLRRVPSFLEAPGIRVARNLQSCLPHRSSSVEVPAGGRPLFLRAVWRKWSVTN